MAAEISCAARIVASREIEEVPRESTRDEAKGLLADASRNPGGVEAAIRRDAFTLEEVCQPGDA